MTSKETLTIYHLVRVTWNGTESISLYADKHEAEAEAERLEAANGFGDDWKEYYVYAAPVIGYPAVERGDAEERVRLINDAKDATRAAIEPLMRSYSDVSMRLLGFRIDESLCSLGNVMDILYKMLATVNSERDVETGTSVKRPTPRQLDALYVLDRHGPKTVDTFVRFFWPGKEWDTRRDASTMCSLNMLDSLDRDGYAERYYASNYGNYAYRLTDAGRAALGTFWRRG